jgi:polyisoprenoid-binding protein YceI
MFRRTLTATAILGAFAAPAFAGPDTYTVDKQHTEAGFQVRHLLTKVRGSFRDVSGSIAWDKANPTRSVVEFRLKTASIDTGVAQRDNHLRSQDFFWADKYPEITFVSTKVVAKAKDRFEVTGNLTIRGITKQIALPVAYLGEEKDLFGNTKAAFETGITINRQDFGLVWNKALETGGVLIGDDVQIAVNLEAAKEAGSAPTN